MRRLTLPALAAVLFVAAATAQPVGPGAASKLPPKFAQLADVRVEMPPKVRRGDTVTFKLAIDLKPGHDAYTYPFFPKDPDQNAKNRIALGDGPLTLASGNADPSPDDLKTKPRDPAKPDGPKDQYYSKSQTWEFKAKVSANAEPGRHEVELKGTKLQVCGQVNGSESCLIAFGNSLPPLVFDVTDEPPVGGPEPPKAAPTGADARKPDPPVGPAVVLQPHAPTGSAKPYKDADTYSAELDDIRAKVVKDDSAGGGGGAGGDSGLLAFVVTAAAWGLISLVTPCVFPMIPITVSIFLKHAHGSFRERIKLAGVYCLTIIGVLGVSAFALLKFMAWLSAHPATNIVLGALFVVLALSLFGMYEITLPNFIARRLQAKQSKGGVAGTVFGALAFTVVSFTCVAPFLGGFAGISAADSGGSLISVPTTREILGGLAFATAFALPFFVLALVPGLLKALPKSGGWLDSVKVVMGFLELAAALKFFRTAELRLVSPTELFTYDLVIAGWVGIAFACALYLFNAYRLPHDEERPSIGVPRLLFAILFLGLGLYLLPAMWKGADGKAQRPAGGVYAWVQAFLLPETEPWPTDLKEAIERSRKSGKPVLIDFTGKTCTNCKYNEEAVFPLATVRGELEKFERVQLYSDEVPSDAYESDPGAAARTSEGETNGRFQSALFGDIALPMYVALVPLPDGGVKLVNGTFAGKASAPFEGKINDPGKFVAWLKESQAKAAEAAKKGK